MRRLIQLHENGTLYFGLAGFGAVTYAALTLREQHLAAEARIKQELIMEIQKLRQDQDRVLKERHAKATFSDAVPLFAAQVTRRVHPSVGFDGPLALYNVHVGDTVQVIERDIGPESAYHMCRNDFGEGLYPKAYLARKPSQ